jgi:hypothetical protein
MKLVLFSGTHPRHLFVNKEITKYFDDILVIIMERENLLPSPPPGISEKDELLFRIHFENRFKAEQKAYGNLNYGDIFLKFKTVFVDNNQLNSDYVSETIKKFGPDFAFIFGVNIIKNPVLEVLPKDKVNLHLGLSPWYKGGATLFWPFYMLQPQFAGITFHQISEKPDAGEVIHQAVPELCFGDGIHDVGVKCVTRAVQDLDLLINHWLDKKEFSGRVQSTTGRVWKGIDFHPSHLKIIYEQFNDSIVDHYLSGELDQRKPQLYSCLG